MNKGSVDCNFKYLFLNHIPIKNHGYSPLHNIGDELKAQLIQKQLEFNLKGLSEKDSQSHTICNVQITDNNILSLLNSRFSLKHSDETGRKGIFFGLYLSIRFSRLELNKLLPTLIEIINQYFKNKMKMHILIKNNRGFDTRQSILSFNDIPLGLLQDINDLRGFTLVNNPNFDDTPDYMKDLFRNEKFKRIIYQMVSEALNKHSSSSRKSYLGGLFKK